MIREISELAQNVIVTLQSDSGYGDLDNVMGVELEAFFEPNHSHGVSILGSELIKKGADNVESWDPSFYYFFNNESLSDKRDA